MQELLEQLLLLDELDVKKALRTAAATALIGGAAAGLGVKKGLSQRDVEQPETAIKSEQPVSKVSVDLEKIAQIESSNNPKAINKSSGARGLYQFMQPTWEEVVKKMGKSWTWDDAFDGEKSKEVADYYFNREIPRLLQHYNLEDTIENRLAAYNWGIGNLSRQGIEKAPQETTNYIAKYMR